MKNCITVVSHTLWLLACHASPVSSFRVPRQVSTSTAANAALFQTGNVTSPIRLSAEADPDDSTDEFSLELKDYSSVMMQLFANVRFPAACFAGASSGAAFVPIVSTGLVGEPTLGLAKRLYSMLMLSALSSEMLAIFVSSLGTYKATVSPPLFEESITAYIEKHFNSLWLVTRMNYLSGLLCFCAAAGLRAWVTFDCPITAKAGLVLMFSSVAMSVAFVSDGDRIETGGGQMGMIGLYSSYFCSLFKKAKKDPLFAMSVIMSVGPWLYFAYNIPMLWKALGGP